MPNLMLYVFQFSRNYDRQTHRQNCTFYVGLASFSGNATQGLSTNNFRALYFGSTDRAGSTHSSSKKLMNFMHFHNSCTQNRDHHILLIMTGNAHKESCHKLLIILMREQGLCMIKTNCNGEMVVAFTIKEINYLIVSLFCQLVLPLFHLYLWY